MKKIIFYILIVSALAAILYGASMYFKPHQNIQKTKPELVLTVEDIINNFISDSEETNNGMIDKVIQFRGKISSLYEQNGISIVSFDYGKDYVVQAYLNDGDVNDNGLILGAEVELKGKYAGLIINDESFMIPADIKFEQCFIVK